MECNIAEWQKKIQDDTCAPMSIEKAVGIRAEQKVVRKWSPGI